MVANDWNDVITVKSLVTDLASCCFDVDVESIYRLEGNGMLRSKRKVCFTLEGVAWGVFNPSAYVQILSGTSRIYWQLEWGRTHLRTPTSPVRNKAVVRDSFVSESSKSGIWRRHSKQYPGMIKKTQKQRPGCWFEDEAFDNWFFNLVASGTYWAKGKKRWCKFEEHSFSFSAYSTLPHAEAHFLPKLNSGLESENM